MQLPRSQQHLPLLLVLLWLLLLLLRRCRIADRASQLANESLELLLSRRQQLGNHNTLCLPSLLNLILIGILILILILSRILFLILI